MSTTRKRLPPEESRNAALEAARALLIEAGPQAVTLKAVSARIGRTHANLLHHFGSALGLQTALATYITEMICVEIAQQIIRNRDSGTERPRAIVDLAFDAFDKHGAAALTSWMILSGNENMLEPIVETIHKLVDDIAEKFEDSRESLRDDTLSLTLMALGDALIGEAMSKALGLPRTRARDIAEQMMVKLLDVAGIPHG